MATLIADCLPVSGTTQVAGVVIPIVIVVLWAAVLILALRRTVLEDRPMLLGPFGVSAVLGG